jgi:nicotinamidase-related amidase
LKENNISKLVICGMMTDVCVASRAAMDYGFENTIITDAVTTKTENLTEKYYCRTSNLLLIWLNALGGLYAKLESSI